MSLASTPSSNCHIESAIFAPMHGSHNGRPIEIDDGTIRDTRGCGDPALIDSCISVVQIPKYLSLGMPVNHSLSVLQTLSATTSHISHSEVYGTITCSLM